MVPLVWIGSTPFFQDSLLQNDWLGKKGKTNRQGAKKYISDVVFLSKLFNSVATRELWAFICCLGTSPNSVSTGNKTRLTRYFCTFSRGHLISLENEKRQILSDSPDPELSPRHVGISRPWRKSLEVLNSAVIYEDFEYPLRNTPCSWLHTIRFSADDKVILTNGVKDEKVLSQSV